MKYKAVLFDMDGTVLNTLGDLAAAVNHTLREFSMPERSIAEVAAALGNGAAYLIAHTVPDGTPKELTDKVLAAYAPYYDAHCDILTGPYDGIVPLMQKLRELDKEGSYFFFSVDRALPKVSMYALVAKEKGTKTFSAKTWIAAVAAECGGKGGGSPMLAQGQSKDISNVEKAFQKAEEMLKESL